MPKSRFAPVDERDEEENIERLKFGVGFDLNDPGLECLSNAEVAIILAGYKAGLDAMEKAPSRMFTQTYELVRTFAFPKDPENNIAQVQELKESLASLSWEKERETFDMDAEISDVMLSKFEIASMINFRPEDVDEAKSLIPSLTYRFTDNQIEEMLSKIRRFDVFSG